ncbi:MAG: type I glutamate--ammonia ligase [Anaerolineae bacterium]|jgi:glutamine synthetase|nr:type I glutamate--ammonia ligase [Anaerolineae bacterium]
MFQTFEEASAFIQERSIMQVDLKFSDLWGRWHHVTVPVSRFNSRLMENGVGFDGSSVGFKSVSSGDMVMVPDLATGFLDPFWEVPTLSFICVTLEADTRQIFPYDPRNIAIRAEEFLKQTGIADTSIWGPEFEFYIFDGVSYQNTMNAASYRVESAEADWKSYELGSGYGIPLHGGYHAIPPLDRLYILHSRISMHLEAMGVAVKYHHHEVGGPGQCEIETSLLPLLKAADASLLIKYITRMTAFDAGMTATFMPKPLYGEAGSGMHFHQHIWKNGVNLCYDPEGYGCMSKLARQYMAGLLHHGGAVMAFTNPSTNSYRRLIPGYEAPISAIFSLANRSAAIRIPKYANRPDSARFEFRPPDATANPYLAMAAQLLAGIDGIRKEMDPTAMGLGPVDENIFSWSEEERAKIKSLPTSLEQAMDALEADHDFLLAGDVFNIDLIQRWAERKRGEERQVRNRPHPYEIELYYDL